MIHRRTFLGQTAAATLAAAPRVFAAGSDTVRIATVGAGERGTYDSECCLKCAPGVELVAMADLFRRHRIDAVIATNTTVARTGVEHLPHAQETGGLSGAPLREVSTRVLAAFHKALKGEIPLIGAGGILSGEDARAKVAAGASLVQLYTGLIYRGPHLLREVVEALRQTGSDSV
jgi:dihydroorotate dehydrogenase